ncbi:unnamed protein product, partial [Darwinula stevensoni]
SGATQDVGKTCSAVSNFLTKGQDAYIVSGNFIDGVKITEYKGVARTFRPLDPLTVEYWTKARKMAKTYRIIDGMTKKLMGLGMCNIDHGMNEEMVNFHTVLDVAHEAVVMIMSDIDGIQTVGTFQAAEKDRLQRFFTGVDSMLHLATSGDCKMTNMLVDSIFRTQAFKR